MRRACGIAAAISWTSLSRAGRSVMYLLLQQLSHCRDDRLQRLQRSQHDLERHDLLLVVPVDHVDPVDVDPVNCRGELEYRRLVFVPLLDVMKIADAEYFRGRREVHQ